MQAVRKRGCERIRRHQDRLGKNAMAVEVKDRQWDIGSFFDRSILYAVNVENGRLGYEQGRTGFGGPLDLF